MISNNIAFLEAFYVNNGYESVFYVETPCEVTRPSEDYVFFGTLLTVKLLTYMEHYGTMEPLVFRNEVGKSVSRNFSLQKIQTVVFYFGCEKISAVIDRVVGLPNHFPY